MIIFLYLPFLLIILSTSFLHNFFAVNVQLLLAAEVFDQGMTFFYFRLIISITNVLTSDVIM